MYHHEITHLQVTCLLADSEFLVIFFLWFFDFVPMMWVRKWGYPFSSSIVLFVYHHFPHAFHHSEVVLGWDKCFSQLITCKIELALLKIFSLWHMGTATQKKSLRILRFSGVFRRAVVDMAQNMEYELPMLVGGAITILRNDGVRQWEG